MANHEEDILRCWAAESQRLLTSRAPPDVTVMSVMSKYLSSLLRSGAPDERRGHLETHLSSRLRDGYHLDEVLEELAILGRCVARSFAAEAEVAALDADELEGLYVALHQDAAVVIDAFGLLDAARLHDELRRTIEDQRLERELRERFITFLAHDLRGPLTVVRASVHLLCHNPGGIDDHGKVSALALRSIVRADRMVSDLLDMMRVRAGQGMSLALAECDLANVAGQVFEELRAVYGERFVFRCDAEVRGVWSIDTVQRMIWNLATNAVKYGAEDIPIGVSVRRLDDGVEISVLNHGAVIPVEAQAAVFNPFSRLGTGMTGSGQGWGLGLALVKNCAEAHGGSAAVDSAAGRGTTFTIKLPLDARPFQALA